MRGNSPTIRNREHRLVHAFIFAQKIILQLTMEFQVKLMAKLYMQTHYISNDKDYNLYRKGLDIDIYEFANHVDTLSSEERF